MRNRNGQAILEFALITPLMFALLALVVDLGTAQWRRTEAQAIAQSAATAAAVDALQSNLQCVYGVVCGTVTCPSAGGNLASGCQSAAVGSSAAFRTAVTLTAGTGAPSGVTNQAVQYWVTANVHEAIVPVFGSLQVNAVSTAVVWVSGTSKGVFLVQ